MSGLAKALSELGNEVTFVAEREMSAERAIQGWQVGDLSSVELVLAPNSAAMREVAQSAAANTIHITQGLRGNGAIAAAQRVLSKRGLQQWAIMETVEEGSPPGSWIKNAVYAALIWRWRDRLQGILANGHATPAWLERCGMPRSRIVPFTYFLPLAERAQDILTEEEGKFRILFVGQIIERKRLDLLIDAVAGLRNPAVTLEVIGTGPLGDTLRKRAEAELGVQLTWRGRKLMSEIAGHMRSADCLVLPSRFDGWGAVVSEALMVGTPAICSDQCGVADVVRHSGQGGVFASGDVSSLAAQLRSAVARGRQTSERRRALSEWARCLDAMAGARYLEAILRNSDGDGDRPDPPWDKAQGVSGAS